MKTIQTCTQKRKRKIKPLPYPANKTLWAYFMQGIEPTEKAINEAFPAYHPLWVQVSQSRKVSGEQFKFFRQTLINITQQQCAAYMRVKLYTIRAWEQGREPVPFMAFELLRVVYESTTFKLSHPDWSGWFITKDGQLVSPDRGKLSFSPHELSYIRETHRDKAFLQQDNKQLRDEVKALKQQLGEVREVVDNGAYLDEIHAIKEKLETMLASIGNPIAKVYQFPNPAPQRKVATA